jgi:hypothetical protein
MNRRTGKIDEVIYEREIEQGENQAPETDRIVRTDQDGNIKRKKDGTVKSTSVKNIEKGILKDDQNFMTKNNIISVGGTGQASKKGVEAFALKLSEFVGTEIKGAYFTNNENGNTSQITIGLYKDNKYRKSGPTGQELRRKLGLTMTGIFHTHPGYGPETGTPGRLHPGDVDLGYRDNALSLNPNLRFYIIGEPEQYGDDYPAKREFT